MLLGVLELQPQSRDSCMALLSLDISPSRLPELPDF